MADLTVAQLAKRLGVSQRRANDIIATGAVTARQLENGTWLVNSDSVARYEIRRTRQGRHLDPATAWALLWELSGLTTTWLNPRTLQRVRQRIRTSDHISIANAVANRTRAHRYRASNPDRVAPDVIGTGRFAVDTLSTNLIEDRRRIQGYVPTGADVDAFAFEHFMVPDEAGGDILYENTLPISFDAPHMPAAVVAADLAQSIDTRERSAGLTALEEMREHWLAEHM